MPDQLLDRLYPDVCDEVRQGTISGTTIRQSALMAVEEHLPGAIAAFGFGSSFAGQYRAYSDVDVAVVVAEASAVSTYCVIAQGVPVDLLIAGYDHLDKLINRARASGVSTILKSIAEGEILLDRDGRADAIKETCCDAIAAGPLIAAHRSVRSMRWSATTQLADLAQDISAVEARAAALTLYPILVRLAHTAGEQWQNRGKWAVRSSTDSTVAVAVREVIDAIQVLFASDDRQRLLAAATNILDTVGGPLCSGQGNVMQLDAMTSS